MSIEYTNPGWVDESAPAINADNLNAISDTLESVSKIADTSSAVFMAKYGETTKAEIDAAIADGKTICCNYHDIAWTTNRQNAEGGTWESPAIFSYILALDGRLVGFVNASRDVYYSDDAGATWNVQANAFKIVSSGSTVALAGIAGGAYAANRAVISVVVSSTRYFAYSDDGLSWNLVNVPVANANYRNIVYANGKFVVTASTGGYGAYSYDGITWTQVSTTANTSYRYSGLAYGNGLFFQAGTRRTTWDSNAFLYSEDGINWNDGYALPVTTEWTGSGFGKGLMVCVASAGSQKYIACSSTVTNGWTYQTITDSKNNYATVDYCNGVFLISCNSSTSQSMLYSLNGWDWVEVTLPQAGLYYESAAFDGSKIYKISSTNKAYNLYSTDGIHWDGLAGYNFIFLGAASRLVATVTEDGWSERCIEYADIADDAVKTI